MTYQELKDRLSKCELTLEKIKNGTYKSSTKDIPQTVEKLTILKESLQKQLAEAEKGIVYTDDEKKAKDLADDGVNVKLSDEIEENIQFGLDETKAIARKVGEAVAKALVSMGDEVGHMKAKKIEPNSFEIYIEYKNDSEDTFSFYITDDTLHLTDFSFDKELVDVGVKPSGEAIVHVDHLANELQKHFKSLSEERAADKYNVNVFGYQTKHYKICPGAKAFMEKLVDGKYGDKNKKEVVRLAKLHDLLFHYEIMALQDANYAKKILSIAKSIAKGIKDQVENMGIPVQDVDYVDSHIEKISDKANEVDEVNEAPDDMYYIKVKKTDKASQNALQNVIETFYHPVRFADIVDDDGAGNIIFYIHKKDFDPGMEDDLMGSGVDIVDTNMPLSEADDKDDYGRPHVDPKGSRTFLEPDEMLPHIRFKKMAQKEDKDIGHQDDEPDMLQSTAFETAQYAAKLVKKLQKYDNFDGEVDFPNWWQAKLILAKDYMQKAYHYLDSEEKQPAIDQLALENVDKVAGGIPYKREGNKFIITEPLDDATKERIMKRAKEHGHHAAPNQAGGVTIMAKEGKKASDGMTTKIKPSEGDPTNMAYTDAVKEMMVTNQETGEDITKHVVALLKGEIDKKQFEKLTGLTKEGKYKSDAQRKAIYATKAEKGELKEELSDDQRDALEELERILDQAGQLGGEARDIIAQSFPNYLSQGDAYGAFNFGDSSNSYDTTLSSIVQSIYDSDEEEDMDEDNNPVPQGKNIKVDDMQFMHDQIVSRMKMLAKIYKEKGPEATVMLGPNNDRKVKVVDTLKLLTKKKRELEDALQKKVAGIGVGQELDEGRGDMDDIKSIISDRAANSGFEEREEAAEVIAAIAEEYMLSLKVIQAYMDSDGPVNPQDVYEAELSKKERSKLKDIVKQLKKSVKGHDAQQKYISTLVKEKK